MDAPSEADSGLPSPTQRAHEEMLMTGARSGEILNLGQ
jgi:hypothetical protein